jgi:hypothetical protein
MLSKRQYDHFAYEHYPYMKTPAALDLDEAYNRLMLLNEIQRGIHPAETERLARSYESIDKQNAVIEALRKKLPRHPRSR